MAARQTYKESFIAPEAQILVVDDTAMNLTVAKGLLKQTQVQVKTAMSGYECLKLAEETAYDVIFLDHRMPGMDGVETLHKLQALGEYLPAAKVKHVEAAPSTDTADEKLPDWLEYVSGLYAGRIG
jgi:CheY-like chemotaxis protein